MLLAGRNRSPGAVPLGHCSDDKRCRQCFSAPREDCWPRLSEGINGDKVSLFSLASDYTLWQNDRNGTTWAGWFKQPKYPSGALGEAAGVDGAWLAVHGPDDHVRVGKL